MGRSSLLLGAFLLTGAVVPEEYEFQVFDRWGRVIFETRDTAEGWNGRHGNDGAIVPEGSYVWKVTARPVHAADKKEYFGTVTLLK